MAPEVLILEDDLSMLHQHRRALRTEGIRCHLATLADRAIVRVRKRSIIRFALIDILLQDVAQQKLKTNSLNDQLEAYEPDMQSRTGTGVVREINSIRGDVNFIFITFSPEKKSNGKIAIFQEEESKLKKHRGVVDVIHRYQLRDDPNTTYRKVINLILQHSQPKTTLINWDKKIMNCAQSVCQVQICRVAREQPSQPNYTSYGTGWLITPTLLLTCWHLFQVSESTISILQELELDMDATLVNSQVTFNYFESNTGIDYNIIELAGWHSHLDYAVLRLGDRQDYPLSRYQPLQICNEDPTKVRPDLIVIQHPGNNPQCRSKGWYVEPLLEDTNRILYQAHTESGTSGSPVVSLIDFKAIALHTNFNRPYNLPEAVLIQPILEDLRIRKPLIYEEIQRYQRTHQAYS